MDYESSAAARAEIPSKGVRLKEILNSINTSKPAENAYEAYQIVEKSFEQSENSFPPEERMAVLPFESMDTMTYGDKEILYSIYNSHVLFIGKSGAIDIRAIDKSFPSTKNLFDKNPEFPRTQMISFFSKAGKDGSEVW